MVSMCFCIRVVQKTASWHKDIFKFGSRRKAVSERYLPAQAHSLSDYGTTSTVVSWI